jgi:phosphoribosylaminoimidazole-succinocarboxamide synthase
MIPVEVVVRRVATGSYLKRYPEVEDGTRFDKLVVEFFYKTKNRELHGMQLPCDDPLMVWGGNKWNLHLPGKPEAEGFIQPLDDRSLFLTLAHCSVLAERVFMILEAAWQDLGGELWDFKLEFGKKDNTLLVADVIDCDSWRVKWISRRR